MAATTYHARTALAILAGILLLCVPPAFLTHEFFLFAAANGAGALQSSTDLLALVRQFGLAELLVFIVLPIICAVAAFKRSKAFLAGVAFVYAAAWVFCVWTRYTSAPAGTAPVGFLIQQGLWALAWLLFFIVCLVGLRRAKVGMRFFPWVLGLGATVACALQWLISPGALDSLSFHAANIPLMAALTEMGANFVLALAVLLLSAAVGKASKKDAAAVAEAKAARQVQKEQAKAAKSAGVGVGGAAAAAAGAGATASAAASASVSQGANGAEATYSFAPAPATIELSTTGDPFAQALSALDNAGGKITLTLDGAGGASGAGSAKDAGESASSPAASGAPAASVTASTTSAPTPLI